MGPHVWRAKRDMFWLGGNAVSGSTLGLAHLRPTTSFCSRLMGSLESKAKTGLSHKVLLFYGLAVCMAKTGTFADDVSIGQSWPLDPPFGPNCSVKVINPLYNSQPSSCNMSDPEDVRKILIDPLECKCRLCPKGWESLGGPPEVAVCYTREGPSSIQGCNRVVPAVVIVTTTIIIVVVGDSSSSSSSSSSRVVAAVVVVVTATTTKPSKSPPSLPLSPLFF